MNHDVTIGDNDKYYLYITAQPSRVRHKKVGLENLKTWDQVKIDGSRSLTLMYLLLNHNIIHNDHTHNFFHDQNHLHPAIVVDKQNGGKTAQKAEKGDAVFDYLIILKIQVMQIMIRILKISMLFLIIIKTVMLMVI